MCKTELFNSKEFQLSKKQKKSKKKRVLKPNLEIKWGKNASETYRFDHISYTKLLSTYIKRKRTCQTILRLHRCKIFERVILLYFFLLRKTFLQHLQRISLVRKYIWHFLQYFCPFLYPSFSCDSLFESQIPLHSELIVNPPKKIVHSF